MQLSAARLLSALALALAAAAPSAASAQVQAQAQAQAQALPVMVDNNATHAFGTLAGTAAQTGATAGQAGQGQVGGEGLLQSVGDGVAHAVASLAGAVTGAGPLSLPLADGSVFQGTLSGSGKQAKWLGIRYAAAPVGNLRFAPPQPPPSPAQGPPAVDTSTYGGVQVQKINYNSRPFLGSTQGFQTQNGRRDLSADALFAFEKRAAPHNATAAANGTSTTAAANGTSTNSTASAATAPAAAGSVVPLDTSGTAPPTTPPATTTVVASAYGPECPQAGEDLSVMNEDCLFLNIGRPSNIPLTTPLPVLVFHHGGGQEKGSGATDFGYFLSNAANNGLPVVVVGMNYRLNVFGFLSGTEMTNLRNNNAGANVGVNLAYQDMRAATAWVRKNIAAFGGDPENITLWGQSAGAFGVSAQLLAHTGGPLPAGVPSALNDTRAPFKAAIMMSGSMAGFPIPLPQYKDNQYQRILADTGCAGAAGAAGRIACLRALDWQTLRAAHLAEQARAKTPGYFSLGAYSWGPIQDQGPAQTHNGVTGFYADAPSKLLAKGAFADVPYIAGNNVDEGTIFAQTMIFSDKQLGNWMRESFFPEPYSGISTNAWQQILAAYPDVASQGSPFSVDGTTASPDERFYGVNNQYKRGAAMYGDIRFHSNRRLQMQSAAKLHTSPGYGYIFAQRAQGAAPSDGVPHETDLNALLKGANDPAGSVLGKYFANFATTRQPSGGTAVPPSTVSGSGSASTAVVPAVVTQNGTSAAGAAQNGTAAGNATAPASESHGTSKSARINARREQRVHAAAAAAAAVSAGSSASASPADGAPAPISVVPSLPAWPAYGSAGNMIQLSDGGTPAAITDSYRADAIGVLNSALVLQVSSR